MGDWFRAAGYRTHYRGKWHISHADLVVPGTHESLRANDADGVVDPAAVDAYRRADRLDPFGFSGWIGREPHGADKADTGFVRDGVFAEQVVDLFGELAAADDDAPVAGGGVVREPARHRVQRARVERCSGSRPSPDSIPDIAEAPSQSDSFAGRPDCQRQFREVWPQAPLPAGRPTSTYRRLYHFLHVLVDAAIMRILDELARVGPRRRHHRRVHVRPRRPARCARRPAAEVAQRVRRGDPRAAARVGPGHRHRAGGRRRSPTSHVDLSRRCSGSPASTSRPRPRRWRDTTWRRSRSPGATSAALLTGTATDGRGRRARVLHDRGPDQPWACA